MQIQYDQLQSHQQFVLSASFQQTYKKPAVQLVVTDLKFVEHPNLTIY